MKAYLIDPFNGTITEVERTSDYRSIYPFLSCPEAGITVDTFDVVRLDNGDAIFVDDEGLYNQPAAPGFLINRRIRINGRGLVCGSDENGDCRDPVITIDELRPLLHWAMVPGFPIYTPVKAPVPA